MLNYQNSWNDSTFTLNNWWKENLSNCLRFASILSKVIFWVVAWITTRLVFAGIEMKRAPGPRLDERFCFVVFYHLVGHCVECCWICETKFKKRKKKNTGFGDILRESDGNCPHGALFAQTSTGGWRRSAPCRLARRRESARCVSVWGVQLGGVASTSQLHGHWQNTVSPTLHGSGDKRSEFDSKPS